MAAIPKEPGGAEVPKYNYVANDQIWKDHCKKETCSAKVWPQNFGFMTQGTYEVLGMESYVKPVREKPSHLQIKEATPISEYVQVEKSGPVPVTTTGQYGWRAADRRYTLDKYGRHAKGKGDFCKNLNWPNEGVA